MVVVAAVVAVVVVVASPHCWRQACMCSRCWACTCSRAAADGATVVAAAVSIVGFEVVTRTARLVIPARVCIVHTNG